MLCLSICMLTICVARFMNSGQGSSKSSSVMWMRLLNSIVSDTVLSTSLVESSSGATSLVVDASARSCRRGVPITSRSIRLCVLFNVWSISLVSVHDADAYITVGVTVLSKSCNRNRSWSVLLVNSCRSVLNFRHADAMRLLSSALWNPSK